MTVVIAAKGYPGEFRKGTVIRGLEGVTGAKVRGGGPRGQGLGGNEGLLVAGAKVRGRGGVGCQGPNSRGGVEWGGGPGAKVKAQAAAC